MFLASVHKLKPGGLDPVTHCGGDSSNQGVIWVLGKRAWKETKEWKKQDQVINKKNGLSVKKELSTRQPLTPLVNKAGLRGRQPVS